MCLAARREITVTPPLSFVAVRISHPSQSASLKIGGSITIENVKFPNLFFAEGSCCKIIVVADRNLFVRALKIHRLASDS
jgi:hypothetical protein